jgi:tetratricopeptide (TPR) repeat protein
MSDLLQTALAAHQAGRWEEAEALYHHILSQTPQDTRARQLLGRLAHQRGQAARAQNNLPAAVLWLRQALELDPQSADAHDDLAAALFASQQTDQALAVTRQAIERWPDDFRFHNILGYLLAGRSDPGAVAAYREAIRLRPDRAETHASFGVVLLELGQVEEARAAFEDTLRLNPNHPEALTSLAQILRDRFPEVHQAAALDVLADQDVPLFHRGTLANSLAEVHDARQELSRAVELVHQSHASFLEMARERGLVYDPAGHHAYVDRIIAAYNPAFFERVRGWGSDSELPIFIVGLPRSGTTLAEQVLASHPQVFGAGELHIVNDCFQLLPARVGKITSSLACLAHLTSPLVAQLTRYYLDRLRVSSATAERIVDKMPENCFHLGLIATLFPRARLIHVRRDPRDVALSCWMTAFRNLLWPLRAEHIRERIREHVRLMEHWRRVLPVPLLEIDYEDLIDDTEAAARRLVAWCGLSWDPACLTPHQTRRVVRTASRIQVRQPIYRRSVGRWKHYEPFLGALFAGLSDLVPGPPAEEKGKHV